MSTASPAAAGKQSTPAPPKTPTKLSRTNKGNTPSSLGQKASSAASSAPKTPSSVSKPASKGTPIGQQKYNVGGGNGPQSAQKSIQKPAQNLQRKAGNAASQAQQQASQATSSGADADDNEDDDGPMSKVTQAGQQSQEGLEQAAPEPIDDDEDENEDENEDEGEHENATNNATDAVGGAKQKVEETADDAEDEADDDIPDDATEKAGQIGESADDTTTDDQQEQQPEEDEDEQPQQQQQRGSGGGLLKGAQGLAGKASGLAGKASNTAQKAGQDPSGAAQDATETAQDAAGDVKEGVEDTAEDAQATAEEGLDEAQKVAGEATDEAGDAADQAGDAAGQAQDAAGDAADGVQEQAEGVQDQAEGAKDQVEQTTGKSLPAELPEPPEGLPLDLSILDGLEVQGDGMVLDGEGNPIGRLAEGDAEDLEGYPIGENGEILDEDGDLVGRVELLPDQIKKQIQQAREDGVELPEGADEYLTQIEGLGEEAGEGEEGEEGEGEGEGEEEGEGLQLPGLDILNGLTCQIDGLIYDADGNTIGQVTDGDPEELQKATLNDQGEFIDEEGNVIGHAEIHEEAADLVTQGIYQAAGAGEDAADEAGEQLDDVAEDAEGAAEETAEGAEEQVDGIEDQLPGIEALEGKELNESGEVRDEGGNILAAITDEDLLQKIDDGEIDPTTLQINEAGEVVDADGNVLQQLELEPGAAERLSGHPLFDLRILEGRKVNKKGKVLDEDGEEIGELREGEISDCAGLKINERGEVLDKKGNLVGRVNVTPGEAAENATKQLLEELGELAQEGPDLSILEGYKVNKKGVILNEDGETIGQLVDGELEKCAGKKVNDKGEVLDKEGDVVGHVTVVGQEEEEEGRQEEGEEEQQAEEEQAEDGEQGPELPPLSILDGLTVNKSGKIIDHDGNVVGELIEGDAKKLSKSGTTCDAEGQFWDNRGNVIGRAQTLPQEDAEEEAPFAGLEGLHVVENGYVQDESGNTVGYVTEGDPKKLIGRVVDEDGDILDKRGSVVGHAERWQEEEAEEEAPADLSSLEGKTVNKAGLVIGDHGVPVARLIEGKAKDLAGMELDNQGQIWNNKGHVIGRVELIPEEEREAKPEGPFAGLEGLRVIEDGKVADEDGNVVGEITEGNPKRLVGLAVDEDGDIVDRYGNVKGHADPLPETEETAIDNSVLNGKMLNKQGYVVDENGTPFGRLVEGDAKELAGRRCDENGIIYGDTGKPVGRCEAIPEDERVTRPEGPFAGYEGLRVVEEGWVEDENGNRVGQLTEGNVKRLVGMAVDEDGDIIDKYGNVKGHAEPWEAEDQEEVDRSALAGCRINKSGNAVDSSGQIIGRIVEGDVKYMIGKKVDGQGQVWDDAGNVIGRCDLVYGEDTSPEGPFAGFDNLTINKDGTLTTPAGDIIGRITEGDIKKLMGHHVDEDGDITDKNGNVIGKAERWEPEEKERRASPMAGRRVNKEGEVRDDNGDIIGRLTSGDLGHCVGQEIDDSGNVVDVDGNKIGECTLIENIADDYEGPSEEELEEARKRDEERQIAEKMAGICSQTLERMQPICKQITEYMEKADRTPKDELDEEQLVNDVKPLIEEGGRILGECNGSLRGLDPDGKIAAQAKGRAGTGEATPEEYRLAETLKELTTTVVTTIDNAKKKLNDMPHAKKKLNPLWSLLTQPLFQILAAVGLLLAGVLGLVGQLLNGLGLGGLVNGLMGGLGINKLMESFGLGGGDKKKSGGGGNKLSSLPIVGGLLGGNKS